MKLLVLLFTILLGLSAYAQEKSTSLSEVQKVVNDTLASKWYEKIQLRGYAHFRYNRFLESNSDFTNTTNDKSIGDKKGFFLRRARLTFFGEVSDRVYIYVQPDFAQDAGDPGQNYFQIRDAYFDYALTPDKEWRIRTGVSKVPFGFDNLQSSSNRPALDRSDAINTAAPNERDTGVFLMYAPSEIRKRFKDLTSNNLKGTGDYGLFAVGAYNGQTLNKGEKNNDLHRIVRVTYPLKLQSGQFIEASLQAYEGNYRTSQVKDDLNNVVVPVKDFYDQRTAASLIYYPQPFGFQMEYNIGQGPDYNKTSGNVETRELKGGYVQVNYQTILNEDRYFPYVRYQEYEGGRKLDNGNHMETRELEFGTEWQPNSALELTVAYAISDRKVESATSTTDETGQLLRLQAQFNY
jgi:Phosphate-selective porin O and P